MKILTPATSANLGPGFDSLGLALKLYNEVVVSPQNFTSVSIVGEGSDKISLRKNNTFINAAALLRQHFLRLYYK